MSMTVKRYWVSRQDQNPMLQEFKPALMFLGKFLAIYLAGNVLYGVYVESFGQQPDRITYWVTDQSSHALQYFGCHTNTVPNPERSTVFIKENGKVILSVF